MVTYNLPHFLTDLLLMFYYLPIVFAEQTGRTFWSFPRAPRRTGVAESLRWWRRHCSNDVSFNYSLKKRASTFLSTYRNEDVNSYERSWRANVTAWPADRLTKRTLARLSKVSQKFVLNLAHARQTEK